LKVSRSFVESTLRDLGLMKFKRWSPRIFVFFNFQFSLVVVGNFSKEVSTELKFTVMRQAQYTVSVKLVPDIQVHLHSKFLSLSMYGFYTNIWKQHY
jgi:hypothetical protein